MLISQEDFRSSSRFKTDLIFSRLFHSNKTVCYVRPLYLPPESYSKKGYLWNWKPIDRVSIYICPEGRPPVSNGIGVCCRGAGTLM